MIYKIKTQTQTSYWHAKSPYSIDVDLNAIYLDLRWFELTFNLRYLYWCKLAFSIFMDLYYIQLLKRRSSLLHGPHADPNETHYSNHQVIHTDNINKYKKQVFSLPSRKGRLSWSESQNHGVESTPVTVLRDTCMAVSEVASDWNSTNSLIANIQLEIQEVWVFEKSSSSLWLHC